MRLADVAWREVDTTTIRNCWRKAGILPEALYEPAVTSAPSVPVSSLLNSDPDPLEAVIHAEKDISNSLNQLEELGVLQKRNRMDLEELLNPVSEQQLVDKISEDEIFRSVQDMLEAEQMMEVNGGCDVDDDFVDEKPTRKEALTAAFTLRNYVADINEPFARKLESILASFGHQTRLEEAQAMEPSYITDYFTRN
jgi:hypothetical protein